MKNDGFIILDKPTGMTSRQVGAKLARMFGAKTFGHIGTLDPMASGLLIIALGEATKMIPYISNPRPEYSETKKTNSNGKKTELEINGGAKIETGDGKAGQKYLSAGIGGGPEKEYLFSIKWGIRTDTDDITGNVLEEGGRIPNPDEIPAALQKLAGEYDQMPPDFSAKKINGVPAYKLARRGEKADLKPKRITVYELEIHAGTGNSDRPPQKEEPLPEYRALCSGGTYVRALVRDIAANLGTVAACSMIRRTKTDGFSIADATGLDFLENMYNNGKAISDYLKPPDFGLDGIPVQNLKTEDSVLFSNGGFVPVERDGLFRVYSENSFIGMGIAEKGLMKPKRIIKCRE